MADGSSVLSFDVHFQIMEYMGQSLTAPFLRTLDLRAGVVLCAEVGSQYQKDSSRLKRNIAAVVNRKERGITTKTKIKKNSELDIEIL